MEESEIGNENDLYYTKQPEVSKSLILNVIACICGFWCCCWWSIGLCFVHDKDPNVKIFGIINSVLFIITIVFAILTIIVGLILILWYLILGHANS